MINASTRWLLALVVLLLTGPASAAPTVSVGTDPNKFVIKGKIVTPDQVIDGELVIEGDTITYVATSCPDPPGATRLTVSSAYILPGFMDAQRLLTLVARRAQ